MRDLEFGVPSLLREGARRLATSPDPDAPWRRLRDGPDSVEQDIANLIGMFDEVCHSDEERALVRDRVKDMLTPRPATDSCGFAHLRDLVQEIERGYSLKDCFVWDDAPLVSHERVTAEVLDHVSERLIVEGVLPIPPLPLCVSCRRTMHHMQPPEGAAPPAMPIRHLGPITEDSVPIPPEIIESQMAPVAHLVEKPGWVLWMIMAPCGDLHCHHCFSAHLETSRRRITDPPLCMACGVRVGPIRNLRYWYGMLTQADVDGGSEAATHTPTVVGAPTVGAPSLGAPTEDGHMLAGGDIGSALEAIERELAAEKGAQQRAVEERAKLMSLVELTRSGSAASKLTSAEALFRLTHTNADNQLVVAETGGVEPLVELTRSGTAAAKTAAARVLWNLATDDTVCEVAVVGGGGIAPLVELTRSGPAAATEAAAGALTNLVTHHAGAIVAAGGVVALVELARRGTARAKKHAAAALSGLVVADAATTLAILGAGGVAPLVELASSGGAGAGEVAVVALADLCLGNSEGLARIVEAGGIVPLVDLTRGGTAVAKECAAGVLESLADVNGDNQIAIAAAGGITALLQLVSFGSAVAKRIAAKALLSLTADNHANAAAIVAAGGISSLVGLLRHVTACAKQEAQEAKGAQEAAAVLSSLAELDRDTARAIVAAGGILPAVELLRLLLRAGAVSFPVVCLLAHLTIETEHHGAIAEAGGVAPLVRATSCNRPEAVEAASASLANLTRYSPGIRAAVVAAGGIATLAQLLRRGAACRSSVNAADALSHLALDSDDNREAIVAAATIEPFVELARSGTERAKEAAARALVRLTVTIGNDAAIVAAGAIAPLAELTRSGSDIAKVPAAEALRNLACRVEHRPAIAAAGGVTALVALSLSGSDDAKGRAAEALANLALDADNKVAIAAAGGVTALVALSLSGSDDAKGRAADALANLAVNSTDNRMAIAAAGGVASLVELTRTGNNHAKAAGAAALWSLAIDDTDNQMAIAAEGGDDALAELVRSGAAGAKEAAGALATLGFRRAEILADGGVAPLVALITELGPYRLARHGDNGDSAQLADVALGHFRGTAATMRALSTEERRWRWEGRMVGSDAPAAKRRILPAADARSDEGGPSDAGSIPTAESDGKRHRS